ncbi:unnamed protein product [Enterobius vermicularis]|uniref:Neur_chan_memb domain-containing protein n=1 Tax=Enterobius vermicularis TaxID=51028 RepID=A0A0N4VJZ1_ENTVE|nr:unnamed protein product [Enterobius vermicularis]
MQLSISVYKFYRLTVTATCPMNLKLFPMDTQKCQLEIESYGYTANDTKYKFGDNQDPNSAAVAFSPNISLPQFELTYYKVNYRNAVTTSGVYERLSFEVVLTRNLGFYLMNIIIPSILIVTISWVSFWLNREASPARVGLGVTTVLTMTTLITTTNNAMPKVSYIKGLDYFLNFCFVMVFASLVEYAVVSYLNKKMAQQRERRRKLGEQAAPVEMPVFYNHAALKGTMRHDRLNGPRSPHVMNSVDMPPECECRTIPLIQPPRMVPAMGTWPAPFGKVKRPPGPCRACTPAKIDKYSRYFFPITFISFNIIYWAVMWYQSWQVDLEGYVKISNDENKTTMVNTTVAPVTTETPSFSEY